MNASIYINNTQTNKSNYLDASIYKNNDCKDKSNYLDTHIYNNKVKVSEYSFNNPKIYL